MASVAEIAISTEFDVLSKKVQEGSPDKDLEHIRF